MYHSLRWRKDMYKKIVIIGLLLNVAGLCAVKENNGWFKKLYSSNVAQVTLGAALGAFTMKLVSDRIKDPKRFARFFGRTLGGLIGGGLLYKGYQQYKTKN
jgi:hypothetical protein